MPSFTLKNIPEALMVALRARAKHERRSLNSQILHELEERERSLDRGLRNEFKPGLFITRKLRSQEERQALIDYHHERLQTSMAGKPSPFGSAEEVNDLINEGRGTSFSNPSGITEET